jgi:hypothetical protein
VYADYSLVDEDSGSDAGGIQAETSQASAHAQAGADAASSACVARRGRVLTNVHLVRCSKWWR